MGVTNSSLFGPKEFWRWETGTIFPLVFVWSRAKYWQKGFYSVKAAFFPVLWLGGIEFFLEPFFSGSLGDIELEACAVPCTGYTRRKCRDSLRCAFLRSKVLRSCPSLPFSEPSCACLLVVTWVFSAIRWRTRGGWSNVFSETRSLCLQTFNILPAYYLYCETKLI